MEIIKAEEAREIARKNREEHQVHEALIKEINDQIKENCSGVILFYSDDIFSDPFCVAEHLKSLGYINVECSREPKKYAADPLLRISFQF